MIYFVSYDLEASDPQRYEDIGAALDGLGETKHFQRSVWLLSTALGARDVRDRLRVVLADHDTLFVAAIDGEWAGWRTKLQAWIQEHTET